MKRVARVQIDYRSSEQEKEFNAGNTSVGYKSVMPGEEVPDEIVARIVVGNPDWLEPLSEEVDVDGKKEKVARKGHGLDEKQLTGLKKIQQLDLLSKYVKGEEFEKLKKATEKDRVKKLLEFA